MRVLGYGIRDAIAATAPRFARAGLTLEIAAPPWSGLDVIGLLVDTDQPVVADDIARVPGLRAIATATVGIDHIDITAASERGIEVINIPDYCVEEVAETTLGLILAVLRGIVWSDRDVRRGAWSNEPAADLRCASDCCLGLLGFGAIARQVALRARALGFALIATDPYVPAQVFDQLGIRSVSQAELARQADVLSIHLPLTNSTKGMIDRQWISAMRPGAIIVNTARGALVDLEALLAALDSGRLGGAALDVLPVEPPSPTAVAPRHERLIVTSHIAWYSRRARERAYTQAADALSTVLRPGMEAARKTSNADFVA